MMKIKRMLFIIVLIALFGGCFYAMNQHYDELARYPYELTQKQRDIVLEHLDTEQINYLLAQKIEPDEFLPFIEEEGFTLENTLWYTKAMSTRKEEKSYIVNFINKYKEHMEYGELQNLLTYYSYNVLTRFYDEGYTYGEHAKLIANPSSMYTILNTSKTIYTYEPKNLVTITTLPHDSIVDNANDIMIQKEVVKPLEELMKAAKEINRKNYGDMVITTGYLSYEDQISLYESKQKEFPKDFTMCWDHPGQSEYQLGYTITLKPNDNKGDSEEKKKEEDREQAVWLKENAYKYGFVIRYPKHKEDVTKKAYQPYTLRYVGKQAAKLMHDEDKAMEEIDFSVFEK